jgi:hypothetical protein
LGRTNSGRNLPTAGNFVFERSAAEPFPKSLGLGPSTDLKTFAERIDYGNVTRIEGRTLNRFDGFPLERGIAGWAIRAKRVIAS